MGDAPVDLAPIRGTDDTLNTLVFIRCRHPLALEMIPSNSRHTQSESETVVLVPNAETVVRTAVLNAECRSAIVAPSISIAAWSRRLPHPARQDQS